MAAQRIIPQRIAHQPVQTFEAFPHVDGFDAEIDPGCQPESEHYARSAMRIRRARSSSAKAKEQSIARPFASRRLNSGVGVRATFTFTRRGLAANSRRQ
jgi:hypothetical protein